MKNSPLHVGIIMDGNRRWAEIRGISSIKGHQHGARNVKKIVKESINLGIKELTIFAFSTENWNRVKSERIAIFTLFERYLNSEIAELDQNNVKFKLIGSYSKFNKNLIDLIEKAENITGNNNGLSLNVALNYGGRSDILHAVKKIAFLVEDKKLEVENIDEKLFSNFMMSKNVSNIDLLIRTSGEQRISNFMLWQLVYSELYFTNVLWPDFDENEFRYAIDVYSKRDRRYGSSNIL